MSGIYNIYLLYYASIAMAIVHGAMQEYVFTRLATRLFPGAVNEYGHDTIDAIATKWNRGVYMPVMNPHFS